ncbi:dienelactone hydrolase [Nakamurella silvestris]|nr:dienelactone hydrolase [Nakamurella silvestris]
MSVGGLLLTPGAGAGADSPTLVAVERAVAPLPCRRVDFPYRLAGKKVPDRPPVAINHLREQGTAFAADTGIDPGTVVFGGRSFGGRMCSMAVAEGMPAAGLILLSYPLHPPAQPTKLRVEHLPRITVPVLAISGERDPFGAPAEFEEHFATIPGPVTMVWVPGNHDPRKAEPEICERIVDWIAALG